MTYLQFSDLQKTTFKNKMCPKLCIAFHVKFVIPFILGQQNVLSKLALNNIKMTFISHPANGRYSKDTNGTKIIYLTSKTRKF